MNDTIARLQGRAASLEGENERLKEEEAKARAELDRAYSRLTQQDHPALQQQLDLTRRRFAAIKAALKQSEGARQRTQSLLDERRGGQMQPHARALLDALEAIEKEVL
jgi:chromosome segregation ATPase